MRPKLTSRAAGAVTAIVLTASGGLVVGAGPVGAAAQTTPKSISTFLFLQPLKVTTSTGAKLTLAPHALVTSFDGTPVVASVDVDFNRSNIEDHDWMFNPSTSTLTANAKTGTGTLNTGTQLGSFGSLDLVISSAGSAKTAKCGQNTTTVHPVTAKGLVDFATGSTGSKSWGNVDKTLTFKGALSSSTDGSVTTRCASKTLCPSVGMTFLSFPTSVGAIGLIGETDGRKVLATLSRQTMLSVPSGATRQDSVFAHVKTTIKKDGAGGKLTLKSESGSALSGSGVFVQTKKPTKSTCKTVVSQNYAKATFTSDKLEGHEQVFGALKATNASSKNGEVSFEVDTKK